LLVLAKGGQERTFVSCGAVQQGASPELRVLGEQVEGVKPKFRDFQRTTP
jgi:hypothetical protein